MYLEEQLLEADTCDTCDGKGGWRNMEYGWIGCPDCEETGIKPREE